MQRYKENQKQDKEALSSSSSTYGSSSSESIRDITERVEQLERLLASSKLNSLTSLEIVSNSSGSHTGLLFQESEDLEQYVCDYHYGPCCSYASDSKQSGSEEIDKGNSWKSASEALAETSSPYRQTCHAYDQFTNIRRVPVTRPQSNYRAKESHRSSARPMDVEREYKNYDTLHYLAQGEFAPVDDGVKLTPSREAVLSDIIWEDVCRAHWPNIRLIKRNGQRREKLTARNELQRQIDVLLRERSARAEKRKRRQLRTKLNGYDQRSGNHGYMLSAENSPIANRKYTSDDCVMIEEINKHVSPERKNDLKLFQRPTVSLDIAEMQAKRYENKSKKTEKPEKPEKRTERLGLDLRDDRRVQNVETVTIPHPIERHTYENINAIDKRFDNTSSRKSSASEKSGESSRHQSSTCKRSDSTEGRKRRESLRRADRPNQTAPSQCKRERSTQCQKKFDASSGPSTLNMNKQFRN